MESPAMTTTGMSETGMAMESRIRKRASMISHGRNPASTSRRSRRPLPMTLKSAATPMAHASPVSNESIAQMSPSGGSVQTRGPMSTANDSSSCGGTGSASAGTLKKFAAHHPMGISATMTSGSARARYSRSCIKSDVRKRPAFMA